MKTVFTEQDIIALHRRGSSIIPADKSDIFTPSAKDKIKELRMKIVDKNDDMKADKDSFEEKRLQKGSKIAIGSDHTGFLVKRELVTMLREAGYTVVDLGTNDEQSCDYPDFAYAVAKKVSENEVTFGIVLDATGNPSAMVANKIKGVRAAVCYNEASVRSAREHNNANIMCLGAQTLGLLTIKSVVEVWLKSSFQAGRHLRRLKKAEAYEAKR